MALRTLILAANPREGGHYAKRAGLDRWTYRVIHGASQVRGLPYAGLEVHILPSFDRMLNRQSILAALRHKRGIEYAYVDPEDLPTLNELDGERQAEELGELTDEQLDSAYAAQAEFDHTSWEAARRREKIAGMSDEDLAKMLSTSADAPQLVKEVKAAAAAAKPKPRKPAAPKVDAATYFGSD